MTRYFRLDVGFIEHRKVPKSDAVRNANGIAQCIADSNAAGISYQFQHPKAIPAGSISRADTTRRRRKDW